MKWNVGTKIAGGFGVALALFVAVGVVSYRSTGVLIEASEARKQTYEVLATLADVLTLLTETTGRARGYVITGEDGYIVGYDEKLAQLDHSMSDLRARFAARDTQLRRLNELAAGIQPRLALSRKMIDTRRARGLVPAATLVREAKGDARLEDVRAVLAEMRAEEEQLLAARIADAEANGDLARQSLTYGTLLALALATLAGTLVARSVSRPLQDITAAAERITIGDLRVRLAHGERTDEVGVLARAFDRMVQALRAVSTGAEQIAAGDLRAQIRPQSPDDVLGNAFARMSEDLRGQIRGLVEGANVLGASASEIVASTAQFAASASESAAAVTETTTTVEEVRQTALAASQKARQVSDSAQRAAQNSQTGRKAAEDVGAGMTRIRDQMEAIAASMVRLSEQSQAIGQIIATVEDLAVQSNLLAVNAAIEATKAGEQGKGFGVVAQEVRSLAEQSRQATAQVRGLLTEIQKASTAAVMATEQGGKAVEAGVRQTDIAGGSIQALVGSVTEAAQAATQIAASSQQQLIGMDQVAGAMESIKQASTQNVASARQLEAAARNLEGLGRQLKQMVERYQV